MYANNNPILLVDVNGENASPYYDENGTFLGVDEKGFSGQVMITSQAAWSKADSDNNGVVNSKAIASDSKTYDDASLSGGAKGRIQTHIVNEKLGDGLDLKQAVAITYDKNLSSFYRHGKTTSTVSFVKLGTANEEEKFYAPGERYYETTVENVRNVVNSHEVTGHGIKGISGADSEHYKCYNLQINNPQFSRTTASFKAHTLSSAFMSYNNASKNMLSNPKYKNMFYNKGGAKEYNKWFKWYKGK